MHKTSPLKKNSFTVWLHFRVLTALLATAVDAILPIVLSAMSDRHRALLSSIDSWRDTNFTTSICNVADGKSWRADIFLFIYRCMSLKSWFFNAIILRAKEERLIAI
jgi:hypothetical protein